MSFPRLLSCLLPWLLVGAHAAQPSLEFLPLNTPAAPGALAPQMINAADGTPWLSWVEPIGTNEHRLMCTAFDSNQSAWQEPREVARGSHWLVNWADTPQLAAAGRGHLAAVWYVSPAHGGGGHHSGYAAWFSTSDDSGRNWSAPARLSTESEVNEFVSVAPIPGDRWMALWLDGRAKSHSSGAAMRLYARILGSDGADELLDERVCDCCALSLATLPDGSLYGVYRDRSDEEVRDLAAVRWRNGGWSAAPGVPSDGWKIAGCPVNGPMLSRVGARLGLVWFTGAQDHPRVLAATSTDYAQGWSQPETLSQETVPLGRVGATYLRDGSLWASWLDRSGDVVLARLSGIGEMTTVHRLPAQSTAGASRAGGTPRLAQVPHATIAQTQLLVARTETRDDGSVVGLSTTLVRLAPVEEANTTATLRDDCGCDRPGAAEEGHPVRGRVVRLLPERESVLVAHEEVPGVMRAMTMAFRVNPRLLEFLEPDQDIVGRMARREDGRWWLFNVRFVEPTPQRD